MTDTPSSLIRRVRDPSDAASWSEFVALYDPLLLKYVRHYGLSQEDAHDVVQDIFAMLVKRLPDFELEHDRGQFRTWLWQVTHNAVADWGRRQRHRRAAEEEWQQRLVLSGGAASAEPEPEWINAYRQRVLDFALTRVRSSTNDKTWACFEQHVLRGRLAAAVAAELGLSANAVYVNASRVLSRVREQCAEYLEDIADE